MEHEPLPVPFAVPPLLPLIHSYEELLASPRDAESYRAAVLAICRRHGVPAGSLAKYAGGSAIVFAVGDTHVVKLFEPIFAEHAAIEGAVLAHVQERLAIPTPGVVAAGELEGWRYVVMTQLRGKPLSEAWSEIPRAERVRLCGQLGAAVAGLHRLPPPAGLPGPAWPAFIEGQVERCVEQQRAAGLSEHWLRQIPAFLAAADLTAAKAAAPVLLHTEIMREHLLVERAGEAEGERWEITGLFDFEPARLGDAEYDLASVGVFLAAGEPELARAYLRGYGYAEADLDAALQQRMMLYTLLHRYSRLQWYLERLPPRRATTLPELAREWFAVAAAAA